MTEEQKQRVWEIAAAMWRSDGRNTAGGSFGEVCAAAVVAGRLDWSPFRSPDGQVRIASLYWRVQSWWPSLMELAGQFEPVDHVGDVE